MFVPSFSFVESLVIVHEAMIEQYVTPALLVAILVFLWKIQSDISSLSQRIATVEGWIKGRFPDVA